MKDFMVALLPWLASEAYSGAEVRGMQKSGEALKLVCPLCDFDYHHHAGIEAIDGEDNYEAWEGRGDAVVVRFDGECGHRWSLRFGSHKGQMYVFWQSEGEVPE